MANTAFGSLPNIADPTGVMLLGNVKGVAGQLDVGTFPFKANNLSDVDATKARTNLALMSASETVALLVPAGFTYKGTYNKTIVTISKSTDVLVYNGLIYQPKATNTFPFNTTGMTDATWVTDGAKFTLYSLAQQGTTTSVLAPAASDPVTAAIGSLYYNTTNDTYRRYNGSAWVDYDQLKFQALLNSGLGLSQIGEVATVTAARLLTSAVGARVSLKEYAAGTGLGGGTLRYVSDSTSADDGVSFFRVNATQGWLRENIGNLTLAHAGLVGNGVVDDSAALMRAVTSRLNFKETTAKTYRLTNPVNAPDGYVNIQGVGPGNTVFLLDHYKDGIRLGQPANNANKYPVQIRDCSVVRNNPDGYPDPTAGPKGLYVANGSPVNIENVEESGAIGFGIQVDLCSSVNVSKCFVHDHWGYAAGVTGTDGIHAYRSTNVTFANNTISKISDDALSNGSYDKTLPSTNIRYLDNNIVDVKGGLKCYAFVDGVQIRGNRMTGGNQGCVYLTNDANCPDGSTVQNILIEDNMLYNNVGDTGNIESGGLRIRFWGTSLTATALMKNIIFRNNVIDGCRVGVSTYAFDANKRISNLTITGNVMRNFPTNVTGTNDAIRVHQCDDALDISNNYIENATSNGISLDNVLNGVTFEFLRARWSIRNNTINGYGKSIIATIAPRALFLRYSSVNTYLCLDKNTVLTNGLPTNLTTLNEAILVNRVSPLSYIGDNPVDRGNVAINANSGAHQGNGAKNLGAAPTVGTHYAGSRYNSTARSVGSPMGWDCVTSGSFDTLTNVTGSGIAGGLALTVNNATGIYVGMTILVAGSSVVYTVTAVNNTVLTLSAYLTANVNEVAITTQAPTFVKLPAYIS